MIFPFLNKLTKRSSNIAFWFWLTSLIVVLICLSVIGTAWGVRSAISGGPWISDRGYAFLMTVADFPSTVRESITEIRMRISGEPISLLLYKKTTTKNNWVRHFPVIEDSGYLLFSGIDPTLKHSVVQLIRISDGKIVKGWNPDWSKLFEQYNIEGSFLSAKAIHPLLLENGDIVFNINNRLVRLDSCNSNPIWMTNGVSLHHSIEFDSTRNAIWTPSQSDGLVLNNFWLNKKIRDDGLALISLDGKLIENRSFINILRDNDLLPMVLGFSGLELKRDPIHMNQIQVAVTNSKFWKKGDLLISCRHLSSVFLYRPATGKILWYQTGPWMNQHSVDFIDDHRISIFDNNVISGSSASHAFLNKEDSNRVLIYDFSTKLISQPFASLLAVARPITFTEGRSRVLPDGGLFLEETNSGRHLRFTNNKLLWSRINDYDQTRIGIVSWSRYLTAGEIRDPLRALRDRKCLME